MKRLLNIFVPVLIATLLLAYMCSFTVRFDQLAVKTTFSSVSTSYDEPGFKFKIPVIQSVRTYPRQVQLLEDLLQEQQTADQIAVVAKLAINWRIDNVEQFYTNVREIREAEKNIRPLSSQLREFMSQYRFDELINTDAGAVKLTELEAKMQDRLQELVKGKIAGSQEGQTDYGIKIERVAIVRLELPQSTSAKVFETMKERQTALAEDARAQGRSDAERITADAESTKSMILSFAQTAAGEIVNEGLKQASQYVDVFNENPDFARTLQRNEGLEKALSGRPTVILDDKAIGLRDVIDAASPTSEK